jgi:hypothetical protein
LIVPRHTGVKGRKEQIMNRRRNADDQTAADLFYIAVIVPTLPHQARTAGPIVVE